MLTRLWVLLLNLARSGSPGHSQCAGANGLPVMVVSIVVRCQEEPPRMNTNEIVVLMRVETGNAAGSESGRRKGRMSCECA
jgi:hypothetical protein